MNLGMENETLEFKKSTSELDKGIISLCAMLNKHGEGTLYFGVKNNGDVIGQSVINESTLRDVSRKISEGIKPQIIPHISYELIGEKSVIKVEVKGQDIPYSAFGIYYSRSFDEDKKLDINELKALINRDGEPDLLTMKPASRQDLTFETLMNLYTNHGININRETFLENLGLLTNDKKYNMLAELLADKNDVDIKVVTFAGNNKAVMLKRTEYGGKCLLRAVQSVLDYMEVINETKVKVGGLQRIEEKYFDPDAFKEAWLNAIVHNRWIEGISPLVCIFSDRIEIDSNGGLPAALSKKDFFLGISKPVNKALLKIFRDLEFIDQTGHGVPLIVNKYGKEVFYISKHTIRVTIPINKELLEKNNSDIYDNLELSAAELKVLDTIRNNPRETASGIAYYTNLSDPYVYKILSNLKGGGYIERHGSNKKGFWKILKK